MAVMKACVTWCFFFIATLMVGITLGQTICSCPEPATKHESCVNQCTSAVMIVQKLWPASETALTVLRIIPKTQEACTNICTAKAIKDFAL